MKSALLLSFGLLVSLSNWANAVTPTFAFSNAENTFDATIVPATDLLYDRPISTTAGPDLGFALSGINDGAASTGGNNGGHDTYFGNGDLGSTSLGNNPAIIISLDTSATGSTTGYSLTSISTLNGWQNYDQSFSDQAYSVYYTTVTNSNFTLLATVNYHPFQDDSSDHGTNNNPTSSLVTLTDLSGAVGVSSLKFVLTPSFAADGTDVQGGSVIREFQATGLPTTVPEPSTYAMIFAGILTLGGMARRKLALIRL